MKKELDKRISSNILIAIEGIDGAGKTTVAKFVEEYLSIPARAQELSKKIGREKYISQRDKFKIKSNESLDFYFSSYSIFDNGIFDRYIGSLYYWGVNEENMKHFQDNLHSLRMPDIAFVIKVEEEQLVERLKVRGDYEKEASKVEFQEEFIEKTCDIYKKLGIKTFVIENNGTIENTLNEIKYRIDSELMSIESDIEYKFHNWAGLLGCTNISNSIYKNSKEGILIDLIEMKASIGDKVVKMFSRFDFLKIFAMQKLDQMKIEYTLVDGEIFINEKRVFVNTKLPDNIEVEVDEGVVHIYSKFLNINKPIYIDNTMTIDRINKEVEQVGDNPFIDISNIDVQSDKFKVIDDFLIEESTMKLIAYFGNSKIVKIPEGVKVLGKHAFTMDLEQLILPKSLEFIFNNPTSHSKNCLIINNSDNFSMHEESLYIKDYSMLISANNNLKNIHERCIKLGKNSFYNYKGIDSIKFNRNLRFIGYNPFVNSSISKIIPNDNFIVEGDILYSKDNVFLYAYLGNQKEVSLSKETRIIGRNAFNSKSALEKINLGEIKEIGRNAFWGTKVKYENMKGF